MGELMVLEPRDAGTADLGDLDSLFAEETIVCGELASTEIPPMTRFGPYTQCIPLCV
jgi:hypothetical protein